MDKFIKYAKYIKKCIISLIYSGDNRCPICGEEILNGAYICNKCNKKVETCQSAYIIGTKDKGSYKCICAAFYAGVMRELILKLKYKNDFNSGNAVVDIMVQAIKRQKIDFDLVTFVPMTPKDERKRGFNQSQFLAEVIGDIFNHKCIKALKKQRESRDQIGLKDNDRWNNLKDAFCAININLFKGKTVLLVDDVVTTGATSCLCANKLLNNGAKEIIILTAAKSRI